MTVWSGRVRGGLAPEAWAFLKADDAELLPYDIEATRMHAGRLHAAGLLDDEELRQVDAALTTITLDDLLPTDEDIHSAIERLLGDTGRKIQAGRSRNDQVAAALRLFVEDACAEALESICALAKTILARADEDAETPMPGYTHLQRAQPVTVGHHLLAWVEMLERDLVRFTFAKGQAHPSPLGSGALAGSTLVLPPPPDQLRNSLDAVGDRDFALDYLYACALLHSHLSRVGEELCLWATAEFGFVHLPEQAATGSSMMPQKLNPDVAELARAKAGTALGRLAGLLAVVKGLPLAYNRDLQEDKVPLFAARRDVAATTAAVDVLVRELTFDGDRLALAAADPLLLATDAAERLVDDGVPFRDAHERVAEDVLDGRFEPPEESRPRTAPGPSSIHEAISAARARLEAF
jgi:argininosuccinate lyase